MGSGGLSSLTGFRSGARRGRRYRNARLDRAIDLLVVDRTIGGLLGAWLALVVGFGVIYWLASVFGAVWLDGTRSPMDGGLEDLLAAVYFSFVTALSIGYGDISPLGPARALAVMEGAGALFMFGLIVSKLVSRRQEELLEETHRIAFEQRLGRVRTSLHLVLSELSTIAAACAVDDLPPGRIRIRAESTVAVLEGEMQTVHDLLYRPEQMPDEQVLESILAGLASVLEVLQELLTCMPEESRASDVLDNSVAKIKSRALEICGDCVPREYAAHLAKWMDRVQHLAARLAPD